MKLFWLLLLFLFGSIAWATPQSTSPDEEKALRSLYGSGIAIDDNGEWVKDNTLYEILLNEGYTERGVKKHIIVVGAHDLDEKGKRCDAYACGADVSAVIFSMQKKSWVVQAKALNFMGGGVHGNNPDLSLIKIGADRMGLLYDFSFSHMGEEGSALVIYGLQQWPIKQILCVQTGENFCDRFQKSNHR